MDSYISLEYKHCVKCKRPHQGFELNSSFSFPATIAITHTSHTFNYVVTKNTSSLIISWIYLKTIHYSHIFGKILLKDPAGCIISDIYSSFGGFRGFLTSYLLVKVTRARSIMSHQTSVPTALPAIKLRHEFFSFLENIIYLWIIQSLIPFN